VIRYEISSRTALYNQVDTFDFEKYGTIEGAVESIIHTALRKTAKKRMRIKRRSLKVR